MAKLPRRGWTEEHDALAAEQGHETWAAWIEAVEESRGYVICGGRAGRKHRRPCERAVKKSRNGRCPKHKAGAAVGPAHHAFDKGKHAEAWLPAELRVDFDALFGMTELFEELAALRAEFRDLYRRQGAREGEPAWKRARGALERLTRAFEREDTAGFARSLGELEASITGGLAEEGMHERRLALLEAARRVYDSEVRRQQMADQYLHRTQLIDVLRRLAESEIALINQHVSIESERRALRNALADSAATFMQGGLMGAVQVGQA